VFRADLGLVTDSLPVYPHSGPGACGLQVLFIQTWPEEKPGNLLPSVPIVDTMVMVFLHEQSKLVAFFVPSVYSANGILTEKQSRCGE
jgi:hypothetical protein